MCVYIYIYNIHIYIYIYVCGLGGPHMGFPALNLLGPGPNPSGARQPVKAVSEIALYPARAWHRPHALDPFCFCSQRLYC